MATLGSVGRFGSFATGVRRHISSPDRERGLGAQARHLDRHLCRMGGLRRTSHRPVSEPFLARLRALGVPELGSDVREARATKTLAEKN